MKFIEIDSNNMVTSVHHMPFDEKNGLGKTKEELELTGILVDIIPEPQHMVGKSPIMYVNPTTKEIYYEYVDIPAIEDDKITALEKQVQQQNQAISDLTIMIAMSQTPSI